MLVVLCSSHICFSSRVHSLAVKQKWSAQENFNGKRRQKGTKEHKRALTTTTMSSPTRTEVSRRRTEVRRRRPSTSLRCPTSSHFRPSLSRRHTGRSFRWAGKRRPCMPRAYRRMDVLFRWAGKSSCWATDRSGRPEVSSRWADGRLPRTGSFIRWSS